MIKFTIISPIGNPRFYAIILGEEIAMKFLVMSDRKTQFTPAF